MALVLRVALSLAAIGVAALGGQALAILPWALSMTALDVLAVVFRHWRPEVAQVWIPAVVAALTALGMTAVQVVGAPAFLLLLAAALFGGLHFGLMGTLIVGWVSMIVGFVMTFAADDPVYNGAPVIGWMTLAFAAALVARLWHTPQADKDALAAQEAKALLIRLGSLADALDTGFDLPALGDWTLAEIDEQVGIDRGAVLLRTDDDAVVVGLRGHTRMPWPAPTQPESALRRTWEESVSMRGAFGAGLDRNFILTVPLVSADGSSVGMIAVGRSSGAFSAMEQRTVEGIASRIEPLVEVGVLFSRLRSRAAIEERSRLARDMHDGVAQELAALAFTVDALVARTAPEDPTHAGLASLRSAMRDSLGDLRNQISTLRMVERPGVSLGAVLSTSLQEFTTNTGLRTTMTLDESPFRFPAHVEIQVQRLALDVLADARTSRATFVEWDVWLYAPNARIRFTHDGRSALAEDAYRDHALIQHGEVTVEHLVPQGLCVEVRLGTESPAAGATPTPDEIHLPQDPYPGAMESLSKDAQRA